MDKPYVTLDGVSFYELGYSRNGKFKFYGWGKTITLYGKKMPVHRAIAYAKATPSQRARFSAYDAHHINGNHKDNRWSNIKVMTAYQHRKLSTRVACC